MDSRYYPLRMDLVAITRSKIDLYDAEKTTFWILMDNFHYTVMPFGLKNAGTTYLPAITVIFHNMLHGCLKDYIDDIVVKSREVRQHVKELKKVFLRCRQYNLGGNPLMCAFNVFSGKFLGFTATRKVLTSTQLSPSPSKIWCLPRHSSS